MSRPVFCMSYLWIGRNRPVLIILLACLKKFNMLNQAAIMFSHHSAISAGAYNVFSKNKSCHQLLKLLMTAYVPRFYL